MAALKDLRAGWLTLCGSFSGDTALARSLLDELCRYYGQEGRHYHTLDHIGRLLGFYLEYENEIADKPAVQFAVWYHDIIYVPGRGDNERESARLAASRLAALGVPEPAIEKTCSMILATATHQLPPGGDRDCRFFLDFDLAILGAKREEYLRYAQQIRQEYHHMPLLLYNRGRQGVLKMYLKRDSIYKTAAFRERFEQKARANILHELDSLGQV